MRVRGHGLGVESRPGWEVRIRRRAADPREPGGRPRPVLHAATVPLPDERGDFGSDLTPSLGPDDVFISLFEHEPEAAGTALFARRGRPQVTAAAFAANALQRTVAGQSGAQFFYTESGRPFCLYVVLGSHARRAELVRKANSVIGTLTVDPGDRS